MMLMRMGMFVRMLVRVFAGYRMIMRVFMLAFMRMCVGVRMGVTVRLRRFRPMRVLCMVVVVRLFGPMCMLRSRTVAGDHIHFGPGDAATAHLPHLEARTHMQRLSRLLKQVEGNAGIHKGTKQHVAADAGKALQISNAHRSRILNGWLGAAPHENFRGKDNIH